MGDCIPGTGSSMKTREISLKGGNTNRKEKSLIDVEDTPFKKEVWKGQCHLYINGICKHIMFLVWGTLVMSFECLLVMEIPDVPQMWIMKDLWGQVWQLCLG